MRRSRKNAAKSSPADAIIEKALKDGSTALSLRGVNITSVPPAVFEMSTLVHLNLSSNQLTDLPPELERLTNLVYLGVHQNPFTRIPDVVFSLKNLEILDISFTPITEIDYRISAH